MILNEIVKTIGVFIIIKFFFIFSPFENKKKFIGRESVKLKNFIKSFSDLSSIKLVYRRKLKVLFQYLSESLVQNLPLSLDRRILKKNLSQILLECLYSLAYS